MYQLFLLQFRDTGPQSFDEGVDVPAGVGVGQADADGGVDAVVFHAEGGEGIAFLFGMCGAGGTGGDIDFACGEVIEHGFAADAGDDDAGDVRELFLRLVLHDGKFRKAFVEVSAEVGSGFAVFLAVCITGLGGCGECGDGEQIFGTAAEAVFLSAAGHDGDDVFAADDLAGDIQCGGTARSMDFMCADGDGIRAEGSRGEAEFEVTLYGIAVDDGVGEVSFGESGGSFDVIDRAGFVIDEHEGGENNGSGGFFCGFEGVFQEIEVKDAGFCGDADDGIALIGEPFCGIVDGRMFAVGEEDGTEDAVGVGGTFFCGGTAEHGDVVGFGTAGSEEEFVRREAGKAEGFSDGAPVSGESVGGCFSEVMDGRRISPEGEGFVKRVHSGIARLCGSGIIKIVHRIGGLLDDEELEHFRDVFDVGIVIFGDGDIGKDIDGGTLDAGSLQDSVLEVAEGSGIDILLAVDVAHGNIFFGFNIDIAEHAADFVHIGFPPVVDGHIGIIQIPRKHGDAGRVRGTVIRTCRRSRIVNHPFIGHKQAEIRLFIGRADHPGRRSIRVSRIISAGCKCSCTHKQDDNKRYF